MRLLLIMRLLLFTIGLKLSRGYYNRGGYYPSAVTITGNTVVKNFLQNVEKFQVKISSWYFSNISMKVVYRISRNSNRRRIITAPIIVTAAQF